MSTIATYQAKTHFTNLVNRVEAGEIITITRHGRPVAKMVPCDFAEIARADNLVEKFRKLREGVARRGGLRGLSAQKLIQEGRRF